MHQSSGILSPTPGVFGPTFVRRGPKGNLIIVPRYRTDAKTVSQLIIRKHFDLLMKWGSKLYLRFYKPYMTLRRKDVNALNTMLRMSIPNYKEYAGIPKMFLTPGFDRHPLNSSFFIGPDWHVESITGLDYAPGHWESGDHWNMFIICAETARCYYNPPGMRLNVDTWEDPCPGVGFGSHITVTYFITRKVVSSEIIVGGPMYWIEKLGEDPWLW